MELNTILAKLPYRAPFLFVDELIQVDDEGVAGTYTFDEDLDFYRGHFYDRAITPSYSDRNDGSNRSGLFGNLSAQ